jgi:hypothetical protein
VFQPVSPFPPRAAGRHGPARSGLRRPDACGGADRRLSVFWIAVIGLIVIIRMKLREIERIQEMGEDREESNAPLLE